MCIFLLMANLLKCLIFFYSEFTSAAVVTLTLGKTKRSVVTSVGAWPPITADAALPPLLTDEGLLQEPVAAAPAATAALTKKLASSICKGK